MVDSCLIPREIHDAAKRLAEKETGIPAANILISATHTHTAPTVTAAFQSEPNEDYVQFLTKKIASGIAKANAKLAPAKLAYGVGEEPNQVFNRRWRMKEGVINADPFGGTTDQVKMNPGYQYPSLLEPAGPTDPRITALAVRTRSDTPADAPWPSTPTIHSTMSATCPHSPPTTTASSPTPSPANSKPSPASSVFSPTGPAATSTTSTSRSPRRSSNRESARAWWRKRSPTPR